MRIVPMGRICFCLVLMVAGPAMAEKLQYDDDHAATRYRFRSEHADRHRHGRHHSIGVRAGAIEPSLVGPAPAGFWYRCDSPPGFYPYIWACLTPWHIVPSAPPR
jgi:hypothetical protein